MMNQIVKNLIENSEEYREVIEEMIAGSKCEDCDGNYKACRFCRLEILEDLSENLLKLEMEAE
ncbi:MAG: hypothetical protein GT589_02020 [Peptoclostridium sp.]|nr:hypothetical protein [Peptoclostridium sp.]